MGRIPKDFQKVVDELVDQGWRYDPHRSGHPMLYPPDAGERPIPVPTTPGDHRSFKNFVAMIRRAGGRWPPPA